MPDEEDAAYDDILNSVEADAIVSASTMERPQRISPLSFKAAVASKVAFNNPGSGTTTVTTSIIDDADISMRSHYTQGGGMAEWTNPETGETHAGPKFEPGEKRRRKHLGLTGEKLKARKLKLDQCVLVRANVESREADVSVFVVQGFDGLAFRCEKGPLGKQILYVLDGDLYATYVEQGIPEMLGMEIVPDDNGNGFALGGRKIQLAFLEQFANSILQRVAKQQIT
jgi:hypothetical protein